MPAPGDQHSIAANPFDEPRPRISEYTAQEIATLQSRLEKQLGPEYLSSRAGPSGQKVHYIAAEKCIALANDVFGFNGWSSSIQNIQVDFVDENPQTMRVSLGLSVIVRVTLRDGTFHEDIGYGHMENCKGKAAAFEKAKKEGTTDGLKRALRNFGNVLGNCIYDKTYLAKVTKLKVTPVRFDEDSLHRHGDFVKKEEVQALVKAEPVQTESFDDFMEDFDEADFCISQDGHPDEVILPVSGSNTTNSTSSVQNVPANAKTVQPSRPVVRSASGGYPNGAKPQQTPQTAHQGQSRPLPGGPNGPNGPAAYPNKPLPPNAPRPPNNPQAPAGPPHPPANSEAPVGFFSARAIKQVDEGTIVVPALQPQHEFKPKFESTSIRKTPGVDHTSSKPIPRNIQQSQQARNPSDNEGAPLPAAPSGPAKTSAFTPMRPPQGVAQAARANVVNPQLDHARRIGAPGAPSSPLANRGSYRPPTMKRPAPADIPTAAPGRPALAEVSSNGTVAPSPVGGAVGADAKRMKMG